MTSAVYLNNIPVLGHASHAIRIIGFDSGEGLDLMTSIDEYNNYDNIYFIENFCDFININDGIKLFNFLKYSKQKITILISEDPNYFSFQFKKHFLLNHTCRFNHFIFLVFLSLLNINLFFLLYKITFLKQDSVTEKIFSKAFRVLYKLFKIDSHITRWLFRSSIYSKILNYQKCVLIPNKRTLGPYRILESAFNLKVFNAKISSFNVFDPVDPFDYEESILKTSFNFLKIYVCIVDSPKIHNTIERQCYFENLVNENSLSVIIKSISFLSFEKIGHKFLEITLPKRIISIDIKLISENFPVSDNLLNKIKLHFSYLNCNNIQISCL